MITVWGRATSSNVQIVMWALGELGLEANRIDVGGAYGGTDTAEYRALNPNGLVPTFRDDEVTLWESAAILRYLAARHGDEAFWPRDPVRRAALDMWAEWMKTTFIPAFNYGVFWPLVRVREAERDPAAIAATIEKVKPLAAMLDARIGEGPYLGGEALSFADIMVGHQLYRYDTLEFDKAATPNLDAYYQRLTARPAYARHAMVSYEPLRVK
ncbi:glutathione S-transferase family protein [Limibaculum sp. M0105]|uniref:Glutathione S-transferase family protein n=1 Tax=Thermohalobaculum xanthum TaxID=2753746 RepID=A0A8J7M501_9RHOB|nr:glutathione S-transferase family protein [Thermohalobaculum xanthum]MBK0398576.1 glutathione S-transferase family protein [Thermohalobaculum xanthum]